MSGVLREVMLIRHPQTEANASGRYIGRGDSPLTAFGIQQMHHLAAVVVEWAPDVVFSSPSGRALLTARAIAGNRMPLTVLDDLAEIDFGALEGRTFVEAESAGMRPHYDSGWLIAPGVEGAVEFGERVRRAAAAIAAGPGRVAVVTHSGVIRRLLAEWLDLPMESAWRIAIPNASRATLRFDDRSGVLESLIPHEPAG